MKQLHIVRILVPPAALALAMAVAGCDRDAVEASPQNDTVAREAALAERGNALDRREADLMARQQHLDELAAEAEKRQTGIDERIAKLETRERQLEERRSAVTDREAKAAEAETRLGHERDTLAILRSEIERDRKELESERGRLESERSRAERSPIYADAKLPAGTRLEVQFVNTVSSGSSRAGERFSTHVGEDVVTHDGILAIPAGSELTGTVVEAVPLKKIGGRASLELRFDEVTLPSGTKVPITASLYAEGRDESRSDAAKIGGAAAGGAVLGRVVDKDHKARGTLLGAILGAAAGTIAASRDGEEIEIPAGSWVTLQLDEAAHFAVPWQPRQREP